MSTEWDAPSVLNALDGLMEGRMDNPLTKRMLDENMEPRLEKGEQVTQEARIPATDVESLPEADNFLSRQEIDTILGGMTARDIFAGMPSGTQVQANGSEVAGKAFESAADRQGYGKEALDRVRAADAIYLATELGEAFASDSPKPDATEQ